MPLLVVVGIVAAMGWPAMSAAAAGVSAVRLAGTNRDATAIVVSQANFPTARSATAVVLASDADYPDALAGSPLAVAKHAPLLLTAPAALSAATAAEIGRVLPRGGTVYLLGGTSAVTPTVANQVTALGDVVERLAGADRFSTAVAIAGALGNPTTVLEATGAGFADGLAAGAAAAKVGGVVLLTNGASEAPATAAYLSAHRGTRYAIGGPAAHADPGATAIVGADRYTTAVDVAVKFFPAPTAVAAASAATFPDALSGGAHIGSQRGPLLLVPPSGPLPATVASYLGSVASSVTHLWLYGGTSAVDGNVQTYLSQAFNPGTGTKAHVMVIMMENHDYSEIVGNSNAPYINQLGSQYTSLTQNYGWTHPSLPNYLELLSGSTQGVSTDCNPGGGCRGSGATLVSELDAVGASWGAYMEGLPSVGYTRGDTGGYAVRHDPFVYFPSITSSDASKIRPISSLLTDLRAATAPGFVWVTPNLTNDMHDGTVAQGDSWLASEIPAIQQTAWYTHGGQIIVEWDEADASSATCCSGHAAGGRIPGLVISAHTHGAGADTAAIDTAGVLASIEHSYGVAATGDAADSSNGSLGGFLQ